MSMAATTKQNVSFIVLIFILIYMQHTFTPLPPKLVTLSKEYEGSLILNTLIPPITACATQFWNTSYFGKSQN